MYLVVSSVNGLWWGTIGPHTFTGLSIKANPDYNITNTYIGIANNFLSKTQLVVIDLLQDVLTRRSLSTAYRTRSEVRDGYFIIFLK